MKKLRIVFPLMLLVSAGAWLSASESIVWDNEQPALNPKSAQADTIRMTWKINSYLYKKFSFCGEEGETYKVDWGDGETEAYTGNGVETKVECSHRYSTSGNYTVLLYGVSK